MLTRYEQASVADLDPVLADWDWDGGRGLLLYGPKGTGKTHAAVAMWRDWINRHPADSLNPDTPFVSVARLFQEKRRTMDDKQTPGWSEPNWKSARFVVFDDWDKCRFTDWVREEMFSIIDTLYCRCVPIILTSNLMPREFAACDQAGEFIVDRLKEMVVPVPMLGASRRLSPIPPTAGHVGPTPPSPKDYT